MAKLHLHFTIPVPIFELLHKSPVKTNNMPFKFEKLEIWNLAMNLAEDIHLITRKFPKEELFNLASQFNRAGDSIALNISEGSIGQSNKEQRKFLSYSIRSIAESVCCMYKAFRRSYISQSEFTDLYQKAEILFRKTNAFRNTLVIPGTNTKK
ncbi:MAG: four helix bundle protein [Saprospiraceae bacterium]